MFYVFCTVNFNWGCGCLHHNLCTMADSEAKVSPPSTASSNGQEADKLLIEKTDQLLTGAGEIIIRLY